MNKIILTFLSIAVLFTIPRISTAEVPVSLKLEPGLAVPLTHPQSDRFNPGVDVMVKPLIGLTPWLDVGPSLAFMDLSSRVNGVDGGTAWSVGGGLRLKRPHDQSNTDSGLTAFSPWVDGDVQYVRTGDIDRAAVSVGAGVSWPTGSDRTVWIGPFVRYQDVEDPSRHQFDTSDAHVGIIGISIELSPPVTRRKEVVMISTDRDQDGTPDATDRCPDIPGPSTNYGCPLVTVTPVPVTPVFQPAKINELPQSVHFAHASSVIAPSEYDELDEVIKLMQDETTVTVQIEGHASSPGSEVFNQKLSEKRAAAVKKYLVQHGIDPKRLTVAAYGETRLIRPDNTEEAHALNRRAEFVVTFVVVKNGEHK